MPIDKSIFDPQTVIEVVNNTPRPKTFLREMLLGGRERTFPTESISIDLVKGKRRMAPFVSPYVGGKLVEREGFSTQDYTPPLIVPRDIITPERLKKRQAGESVVSGKSPADRIAQEIAEVYDSFDQYITRREEWMIAQLIFTGAIHMVGDGVDQNFDVGFTNSEDLSGDDLWDAGTSDPMADLKRWKQEIIQKTGITPDVAIMGSDVADVFLSNATVLAQLDTEINIKLGTINPREVPNGAQYLGTLNRVGLDLYCYDEYYVDDTTSLTMPMIPAGAIVIAPTAARNTGARMLYGAFTEMKTRQTYESPRIPREWVDESANAQFIEIVSRPLPTMVDVDCWYVGNVLSDE